MHAPGPTAPAPLAGLTVLDLTRLLPGPYCAWFLRSWGARVVKVEDPRTGDYLREMQPAWFAALNAGAESIGLDLKRPGGREVLLRLAARADLVLESFRPGVLDRFRLTFADLAGANPRLVLVSLSGYGPDAGGGYHAGRAGHDINYLARSGLLSLMGEMPPLQLADLAGGLTGAAAALAAAYQALRTGRGSHVEVPLYDAVRGLGAALAAETQAGAPPARAQMLLAGALPCYNIYETADGGRITLGALEPKFWVAFCQAAGRPDLLPRQMDPSARTDLQALFHSRPLAEWASLADSAPDACLEPVRDLAAALRDESNFQPARFDGTRPAAAGPAPARGEHTLQFLREVGFSEQELCTYVDESVILQWE